MAAEQRVALITGASAGIGRACACLRGRRLGSDRASRRGTGGPLPAWS